MSDEVEVVNIPATDSRQGSKESAPAEGDGERENEDAETDNATEGADDPNVPRRRGNVMVNDGEAAREA